MNISSINRTINFNRGPLKARDPEISIKLTADLKVQIVESCDNNGACEESVVREEDLTVCDDFEYLRAASKGVFVDGADIDNVLLLRLTIERFDREIFAARFSNPDLSDYSRSLFGKYLMALSRNDDKAIKETMYLISAKLVNLQSESLKAYTGREDYRGQLTKEERAFSYIFELLGSSNSKWFDERDQAGMIMESYKNFLPPADQLLINKCVNGMNNYHAKASQNDHGYLYKLGAIGSNGNISPNYKSIIENSNLKSDMKKEGIDYIKLRIKINNAAYGILNKISEYQKAYLGAAWGTPNRAECKKRLEALTNIASYGIGIQGEMVGDALDGRLGCKYLLEHYPDKYKFMAEVDSAISTPEESDDKMIRDKFLPEFRDTAFKFFSLLESGNPDMDRIYALAAVYSSYESSINEPGGKLNISRAELMEIENEVKGKIKNKSHKIKGATYVGRPDELPEKLKAVMRQVMLKDGYSYFDYVKDNLNYIVFSSELKTSAAESAMFGGGAAGFYIGGGIIVINTKPFKLDNLTNDQFIELFGTIVHETRHCQWARTLDVDKNVVNQQLPNESEAFWFEAQALEKLKNKFPELFPPNSEETMSYQKVISLGAADIFGSFNFLKVNSAGIDTDIYPTKMPYPVSWQTASSLEKMKLISKEEIECFADIISDLIQNKTQLGDLEKIDAPAAGRIHSMLAIINAEWASMSLSEALCEFQSAHDNLYSNHDPIYKPDYLDSIIFYSSPYQVSGSRAGLKMLDASGKNIGAVPSKAKVKLAMSAPKIWNNRVYCEVVYNNKKGYVLYDGLNHYFPD